MRYTAFDDSTFRRKVQDALKSVDRVLDIDRKPKFGQETDHEYQNKYDLADQLTNNKIVAVANALRALGLNNDILKSIDTTKPTTLSFQVYDSCTFVKECTVDVQSSDQVETQEEITVPTNALFGKSKKSVATKVVKKVKEYHWKVEMKWEIFLYSGTNINNKIIIAQRFSSTIIITQSKNGKNEAPIPKHTNHEPIELSMNWFFQQINIEEACAQFHIHRSSAKTPCRNVEIEAALGFCNQLNKWSFGILAFFRKRIERSILNKHNPAEPSKTSTDINLKHITSQTLFCPILPLMEDKNSSEEETSSHSATTKIDNNNMLSFDEPSSTQIQSDNNEGSPLLSNNDMIKLLNEQVRTLEEAVKNITNMFPPPKAAKLVSTAEATLILVLNHITDLVSAYNDSISYIESMLYHQLVAAIGKEVQSKDLDQFVKYHNTKLLHPPPQSLCRSIRRPNHYPDGLLSIERQGVQDEPIDTMVQPVESSDPIKISLNSATTIELTGDKFLHGWLQHRFGDDQNSFHITARARQFSSFVLVIGTMIGPSELEPKDAIIVQNKDEVLIPLLLEELPAAKEFKDAIQSLSPEQQRFAKEFRSMQLESSVFGMCVIQIKPQLESLLCLPSGSLTKEMKLTQDLMELFIEYQVPSDLLSYDGYENFDRMTKVEEVKDHVSAVLETIEESKEKQLEEEKKKADMRYHEKSYTDRSLKLMASEQMLGSNCIDRACGNPNHCEWGKSSIPLRSQRVNDCNDNTSLQHTDYQPKLSRFNEATSNNTSSSNDVTSVPKLLDSTLDKYDTDGSIRSTIIKTKSEWKRTRQENLLTKPKQSNLSKDDMKSETNKAFDLLDALSRSGSLSIECSELHVVVAVTHRFDKNVIGTIIEDNVNPIEKLEKSTLLVASIIYGIPIHGLIRDMNMLERLSGLFPALFDDEGN